MTALRPRGGYTSHVRSQRRGPFDIYERADIYPKIRASILRGDNDVEIARHLGISERTVGRYRKRHGYPNPRGNR